MKKYILPFFLFPITLFAQKAKPAAGKSEPVVKKENVQANVQKPADGYQVFGNVTGYADSTPVSLHNGNTGALEWSGQVVNNKFMISGKLDFPDVKVLVINNKQPYKVIFLDNSNVNINGRAD